MTYNAPAQSKLEPSDALVAALRDAAEPLPDPANVAAFGAHFDRFGDARTVSLGEATHGSAEFYRARAAITREREPAPRLPARTTG